MKVKPDATEIKEILSERLDIEGLYLCGPFDDQGEPESPDLHILAVSCGGEVKDFHYIPGVAGISRRLEVSVVPIQDLEAALQEGVRTWLMFYTFDKLAKGRPITESQRMQELRQNIDEDLKIKASLYSHVMRSLASAIKTLERPGQDRAMTFMSANAVTLLSLSLHRILRAKQAFSRLSELLVGSRSSLPSPLPRVQSSDPGKAFARSRHFLESFLAGFDLKPDALLAQRQYRPEDR